MYKILRECDKIKKKIVIIPWKVWKIITRCFSYLWLIVGPLNLWVISIFRFVLIRRILPNVAEISMIWSIEAFFSAFHTNWCLRLSLLPFFCSSLTSFSHCFSTCCTDVFFSWADSVQVHSLVYFKLTWTSLSLWSFLLRIFALALLSLLRLADCITTCPPPGEKPFYSQEVLKQFSLEIRSQLVTRRESNWEKQTLMSLTFIFLRKTRRPESKLTFRKNCDSFFICIF